MAKDRTISQPSGPAIGPPPPDAYRAADIILTEIAKLQSDGEYTKRDMGEMRADIRDLRDRMSRLEVRVDHLPTKGYIVGAMITSLTIIVGLLTIAPKLQSWAGTAPPAPPAAIRQNLPQSN